MILVYLHKYGEGSGYDFMKFCKEKGIAVSAGSVYPHLSKLSENGFVEFKTEGKRKKYFLTEKGKNLAQKIVESRENLKEVFRKLGVTVGFDAPEFVEKRINSIFTALRKVNWEQKRNIEKLIKELEEFIEDLRRWNNEESH
ncbi:MAG: PadR family transcriptional regulator [Thermotogaceae bacterium]|nr:PadR family transcriptional regulator [Thermotogaceae bacterium]